MRLDYARPLPRGLLSRSPPRDLFFLCTIQVRNRAHPRPSCACRRRERTNDTGQPRRQVPPARGNPADANDSATASGAPGHAYWQQRADYVIDVDARRRQPAHHRSRDDHLPQPLTRHADLPLAAARPEHLQEGLGHARSRNGAVVRGDDGRGGAPAPEPMEGQQLEPRMRYDSLESLLARGVRRRLQHHGGHRREGRAAAAHDRQDDDAHRPAAAARAAARRSSSTSTGTTTSTTRSGLGGRTGYEYFPKDGNYIYEIAQWFPRMAAYTDVDGLAAQAVPRRRRVHARVRRLRRAHHRARPITSSPPPACCRTRTRS